MKRLIVCIASLLLLLGLVLAAGCGGGQEQGTSNAPTEAEVGAPVYPGASFTGTGVLKSTHKYTTKDSSTKVVDWYRNELEGKPGFTETNEFKEATTGDALNYKEDGKTIWITVLPGLEDLPTTIDISVDTDYGATTPK